MLLNAEPERVGEATLALWVILSWPMAGLGALLCLLNIYLSFARFPLHRLRGGTRENYKWKSGIPIFGSLLLLGGLRALSINPWLLGLGIVLIVFDTGGLHWFVATMAKHWWDSRRKSPDAGPTPPRSS